MIEATDFRNAMSLLTTAVNVITTNGETGMHGFTASAVCSVTDTPPTLLICMNQSSRSYTHFMENEILSVNVLIIYLNNRRFSLVIFKLFHCPQLSNVLSLFNPND